MAFSMSQEYLTGEVKGTLKSQRDVKWSKSYPFQKFKQLYISYLSLHLFILFIWFQNLQFLSSGMGGRSSSPVAILFDTLTHPYADLGQQVPSLLEWKTGSQSFDHVVLGKRREGGVWQVGDWRDF